MNPTQMNRLKREKSMLNKQKNSTEKSEQLFHFSSRKKIQIKMDRIKDMPVNHDLNEWLNFPKKRTNVPFSMLKMLATWLLWTDKAMLSVDPGSNDLRQRILSKSSILGTAASLFLVIGVEAFLNPPEARTKEDEFLVDIFGCLMFLATSCFVMYIGVTMTGLYPIVESMRDDVVYEAFNTFNSRWGGYENLLFNVGLQLTVVCLVLSAKILYSGFTFYFILGILVILYSLTLFLARELFISMDPISAMHLGITNNQDDYFRSDLLAGYIRSKDTFQKNMVEGGCFLTQFESAKNDNKHVLISTENMANSESPDLNENINDENVVNCNQSKKLVDFEVTNNKNEPVMVLESISNKENAVSQLFHEGSELQLEKNKLPSFYDMNMFQNDNIRNSMGLKPKDGEKIVLLLSKAGFLNTEDLLFYLFHCSPIEGKVGFQIGLWVPLLSDIGIPPFHAFKMLLFLKPRIENLIEKGLKL